MSEVNNISVESMRTSKSTETNLPVESYIERLNSKLKEFSSTMSVDTEALTNEPKGGSWEEVEQYLNCIEISEKQPESITLPYWGSVQLPSPEELAEPNTEEYTPEDVLGRLFVVNAALNVEFDYYNEDTSKEESMTLGQLIGDVYPGLEEGVKEIRKALEFAFRNPEGFKKKYSEKERNIGGLTRRAFIKKGVEVTAASLFVLTSMTLASCSSKQLQTEPARVVETYTPTVTKTEEEPTPTPTKTQEPSPTPTQTETPEPLIEGNKEIFTKDMVEGDVLWNLLKLQEIVNGYDEKLGITFQEYIVQKRHEIEDREDYQGIKVILEEIGKEEELSGVKLAGILQKTVPELNIVSFSPWPESMYDVLGDSTYSILSNPDRYPFIPGSDLVGDTVYEDNFDILCVIGDIKGKFEVLKPGVIIVNTDTFDKNRIEGFNPYVVLDVKEDSGEYYILLITVDEKGDIKLLSVPESESQDIFGQGRALFWIEI
jgi:hypothetical protein